jgi:nucleotide-binding universal stress UspA family protein
MPGILLATVGGAGSDGATRVASLAARRLGATLHTVVVYEPPPVSDYGFGATYVQSQEDDEAVRESLASGADEQLRRCGVIDVSSTMRVGHVAEQIAGAARELGVEFIVAGLGPHDVVNRALRGEKALQLAQIASTPVLAVPATAETLPKRAVVAIDFSPTSVRAARMVAKLLTAGDTAQFVHVAPSAAKRSNASASGSAASQVKGRLEEIAATIGLSQGVQLETVELYGTPAPALLDQAERVDADLIALGSHGYGVWKRFVLGSVASKIIRLSQRCVLVAPIGCL